MSFEHVFRMSDDTGLLEHARGALPRRECGYCLDDVARGLLAVSREPDPSARQVALADRYLTFVAHSQGPDGGCRNRLGYDRRWEDKAATGDWWGRALFALGSVVSGHGPGWQRAEALDRFSLSCRARSPWLRTRAFAALGAAEVLEVIPQHTGARQLLEDTIVALARPSGDDLWPWPEERLSYANPTVAEALLAAGWALDDDDAIDAGLRLLEWLVELQTVEDHLSVVPAGGWGPGEPQPGFDQQPIEVAALADASARAFTVTADDRWQIVIGRCVRWFLGANDVGVPMHDPETGGGYDGLTRKGPNLNQGAESTLAWLLTLQHGRQLASSRLAVAGSS